MTDEKKLGLYRQALVQICQDRGGEFYLPPPQDSGGGTLMNRPTEDGGIEFKFVPDASAH
jgi:hypothetical protein